MSSQAPLEAISRITTFSGHTKGSMASESQVFLNNFKKGIKRDASAYPIFKSDLFYDTFQRSSLAIIKAQGCYDVADPDFDPEDGDQYDKQHFEGKILCVICTGYSLHTDKGRELVKEFEEDARTIISKLYHDHTESDVSQH